MKRPSLDVSRWLWYRHEPAARRSVVAGGGGSGTTSTGANRGQKVTDGGLCQELFEKTGPVGLDLDASRLAEGFNLIGGDSNVLIVKDEGSIGTSEFGSRHIYD